MSVQRQMRVHILWAPTPVLKWYVPWKFRELCCFALALNFPCSSGQLYNYAGYFGEDAWIHSWKR